MKKRILIIEDNAQNLYLMRFLLESAATEPQASENLSGAFLFVQNCYNTSE